MRLTPKQLRKIITEETRKVLREVVPSTVDDSSRSSGAATGKVPAGTNTGDDSAGKVMHDFFSALNVDTFKAVVGAALNGYKDLRAADVEREALEGAPMTVRSPGVSERLLRSYLRMLFEVAGDDNDFKLNFPALYSFGNFYLDNEAMWSMPYKKEMENSIFRAISEFYDSYHNFIDKAFPAVIEDFVKISKWVGGEVGKLITKYIIEVINPSFDELKKDMPSGKGMGWSNDPRVNLDPRGEDPSQQFPAKYAPTTPPPNKGAWKRFFDAVLGGAKNIAMANMPPEAHAPTRRSPRRS